MDFALSSEQKLLRQAVREYCDREYRFAARQRTLHGDPGFSRDHWRRFADLGWLGAAVSEKWGGAGGDAIDLSIILTEFGRYLVLEPYVASVVYAGQLIAAAGTEGQRQYLLREIAEGNLVVAVAHDEGPSHQGGETIETRAVKNGVGHYFCTGRKAAVMSGGCADHILVSARTGACSDGSDRISAFLIPTGAPGVRRRCFRTVDGGCAADIELDHVELAEDALIGQEGEAAGCFNEALDWAIIGLCAEATGAMDAVVTMTAEFLKTRRAYGTTLSTFQALQHRLADMLVELELSRSILFRGIRSLSSCSSDERRREVAAAKALIGRSGRFVGSNGVQLHGGMGMSDEYPVGHLFKRLTAIERWFGTSDTHLYRLTQTAPIDHTTSALAANV